MSKPLAGALLVGLLLRLGAAFSERHTVLAYDEANYASIAQNIAARGEFSAEAGRPTALRTPLYPAFLAVFARLWPDTWSHARVVQALLDTTTILLLYAFGLRALRDEREAFAGAALYALYPVFIAYSARILTETLFLWLWMLALLLLLRAVDSKSRGAAIVAGIALGLPALCRPNAVLFPAAGLAALAWVHRGTFRKALLIGAVSYLTLVPWMARNRLVMGSWSIATQAGGTLWVGSQVPFPADTTEFERRVRAGRTDFEAEAEFYRLAKIEYRRNAGRILKDMPHRFLHFWLSSHSAMFGIDKPIPEYRAQGRWAPIAIRAALWGLHLTLLLLGGWGLWSIRQAWTMGATLAVAAAVYYSQHVFLTYWGNRYHLPALILLFPFAGAALVRLTRRSA